MDSNNDFIKDWLEGKISQEEIQSKKRNEDPVVKDFHELITKSARLKTPETVKQDDAWKKLSAHIESDKSTDTKTIQLKRWIPLSIAAAISLFIVAFLFLNRTTTISTPLAEIKTHILPDGSEVILNAGSEIEFKAASWSSNRKVTLKGEAFFHVKKGSSFTVATASGNVTVLGTTFNVNARSSTFAVSCYTGKVKVDHGTSSVTLTKGLATSLHKDALSPAQAFDDTKSTWREGDFYFNGTPLHMVLSELERQFNVNITFHGDSTRLYHGYFSNKDLDQAMIMVLKPMSLHYERDTNQGIIVK
ncbi:FecR family protein [Pseudochryseolinea flava]|uniref:FecR protein domain-containing protein n=1 Tax=Pseudochryseolinea flava TaxID=2059302 RepID=A0A364Y775_9BACT|nr:FecR family protein [Pseudochryseolinea flava]RAW02247.1 hypothetical protein DQQ10_06810 [Pseudochryseolinea flava]